ncbi:MAG: hypothetical protein IIX75_02640 [Clostridia bacterium]|nr:hypothetical protein [Clostridia bacterium]
MNTANKRRPIALLCLLLVSLFLLGGCSIGEDSSESRTLCEEFLDYVIEDNRSAAYDMCKNVASEKEFNTVWEYVRAIFKDSKSYELKQMRWDKNTKNGVTSTTVTFEATTDDEKICMIYLVTMPEIEGIAGVHFTDVTEFVEKTKGVEAVNIILRIVSLAVFGFVIWMFVDCMKRSIKKKVLWAIIICAGFAVSVTYGAGFGLNFRLTIPFALSGIGINLATLTTTITLALPLGAIIYFFARKKLPLKETVQNISAEASQETPDSDSNPESTVEANTEENTNTEDK